MKFDSGQPPSRPARTFPETREFGAIRPAANTASRDRHDRSAIWFTLHPRGGNVILHHRHIRPVLIRDWSPKMDGITAQIWASQTTTDHYRSALPGVGGHQGEAACNEVNQFDCSYPKALHPNAVRVMREWGIDISGRRSKPLSEFVEQRFDHVISLCDRVREVCPDFPGPPAVAHWSIPDPAAEAAADEHSYPAFVRTADELNTRIQFLLSAIEHHLTEGIQNVRQPGGPGQRPIHGR
jgi:hypothetical protein